jgi:hypothetical protein
MIAALRNLVLATCVAVVAAPALAQASDGRELQPEGVDALPAAAKAEYQAKYVAVGDAVVVTVADQVATIDNSYELYRGKYRDKLSEDAFFDLADRPDLAKWYRNRQALKTGLLIGGVAVATGGLVAGLTSSGCDVPPGAANFASECVNNSGRFVLPMVVIAGGGLIALVGGGLNSHPVEASQMRRLAEKYNTTLLDSLESPAPKQSSMTLSASPFASADGGGLFLSGTF